jgi:methionyl aminopeptidase
MSLMTKVARTPKAYNTLHPLFTPRIIRKGLVSPPSFVPEHIKTPTYYAKYKDDSEPIDDGIMSLHKIDIKNTEQIEGMRQACKFAQETLKYALSLVEPGITTDAIDKKVHEFIISHNAYPSPLHYRCFKKSICTSVNEVMVHGIPDDTVLHDGDIINIDVTVYKNGFHGDNSNTIMVGDGSSIDPEKKKQLQYLIETSREATYHGISKCGPGVSFSTVGTTIEKFVKSRGFSVSPDFCGHGIGHYFHGYPQIMHYKTSGHRAQITGILNKNSYLQVMRPGMTFTIEPVICGGSSAFKTWKDKWTIVSQDRCASAQCEHTILLTENGVEILTR